MEEEELLDNSLTEYETRLLEAYIVPSATNPNVYGFKNLPQKVVGCLITRNSRTGKSAKKVIVTEFMNSNATVSEAKVDAMTHTVLGKFADDSAQEQNYLSIQFEQVSMLLAKQLERSRFTSPIEKSTRYIPFHLKDAQTKQYLFYRGNDIREHNSLFYTAMIEYNTRLFEAYATWLPILRTEVLASMSAQEKISMKPETLRNVVRTKVLDALRLILPAGTLTNVGITANTRTFESVCLKLQACPMGEMKQCAIDMQSVFKASCPEFTRRNDVNACDFAREAVEYYKHINEHLPPRHQYPYADNLTEFDVQMEDDHFPMMSESQAACLIFKLILFKRGDLFSLPFQSYTDDGIQTALRDIVLTYRTNRRFKPPRAFECVNFLFFFETDFKVWCDLQRHRMATTDNQLLTCDIGFVVPDLIKRSSIHDEWCKLMLEMGDLYNFWLHGGQVSAEYLQYMVPMGYKMRWYWHVNLRELFHILELRTAPEGHPTYRRVCQRIYELVADKYPFLASLIHLVNMDHVEFNRLASEKRLELKQQQQQ
jgi:thymidylate synthase ThyX